MMTRVNLELSRKLAQAVDARPGECYRNAYNALLRPGMEAAVYCEGHVIAGLDVRVVLEHAWLELDGEIVDPTFAGLGIEPVYFCGLRLAAQDVREMHDRKVDVPLARGRGLTESSCRQAIAYLAIMDENSQ